MVLNQDSDTEKTFSKQQKDDFKYETMWDRDDDHEDGFNKTHNFAKFVTEMRGYYKGNSTP